jgi:hypothetical protein
MGLSCELDYIEPIHGPLTGKKKVFRAYIRLGGKLGHVPDKHRIFYKVQVAGYYVVDKKSPIVISGPYDSQEVATENLDKRKHRVIYLTA